ncbi:hypothetical protein SDJN02_23592, partial [Cucurbita argyrosperma subsp. argyrosperma]
MKINNKVSDRDCDFDLFLKRLAAAMASIGEKSERIQSRGKRDAKQENSGEEKRQLNHIMSDVKLRKIHGNAVEEREERLDFRNSPRDLWLNETPNRVMDVLEQFIDRL